MKKIIILTGFSVLTISFNSCAPAYVSQEPTYVEVSRPPSPGTAHIWISGDWVWHSSRRVYVHQQGYWAIPSRGRSYVGGYWQSSPRGRHWVRGRWALAPAYA